MPVLLFSLVLAVAGGFVDGDKRLLLKLWEIDCFPKRRRKAPTASAYQKACAKLPVEAVVEAVQRSHLQARTASDALYHGRRVKLHDGTKITVPRTPQTIAAYGLGKGSKGEAYYPQIHAVATYDLATRTFSAFNIDRGSPAEREVMREDARQNTEKTLYVADAGLNGAAHVFLVRESGHDLLMPLKMGKEAESFRKSRQRSRVIELTLTAQHLKKYPDHKHLIGVTFKVRLIRTEGTSRLRSLVLISTLLDEDVYPWRELALLYLQRRHIEVAFRHLKVTMRLEHIRKLKLHRIRQAIHSAILLYNLASMVRNQIKPPGLFPEKKNARVYCLEFAIEFTDLFCLAAIHPARGQLTRMRGRLKALRQCFFLYVPWRIRPRICQFPSSLFTRQKTSARKREFAKCAAIKEELKILGVKYGQLMP